MPIPPRNILSSKKAQDTSSSAATLIAVIALLIIFYLLFIPPAFRDQILEGNDSTTTVSSVGTGNETILRATPGTLSSISSQEMQHTIPALTLFSKKESKILGTTASLSVKSTIFSYRNSSMKFNMADLENTDNVLLTFTDTDTKGNIIIKINGNEIFNSLVTSENPDPISIDKSKLVQGENIITLEPERAGWRFWRINRHNLGRMQVTGDVKDISRQKSMNIFVITATERENAKRTMMRFLPDCATGKVGKLNVLINQHSVYYSVPDCGTTAVIEFATDILREGENTIVFDSEEGNYLIDMISISSEMKTMFQPAYYFDITSRMIKDVRDGKYGVTLKITFVEGTEQKVGKININGRETNLFQTGSTYTKNLNDYVIEGSNAIKIVPETTLEIASLEVLKQ